jgi:endonuclease V-like protein UPF0215 family
MQTKVASIWRGTACLYPKVELMFDDSPTRPTTRILGDCLDGTSLRKGETVIIKIDGVEHTANIEDISNQLGEETSRVILRNLKVVTE